MASEIEALGYLGLEVSDLDAWRGFAGGLLGLQALETGRGELKLRMDGYASRFHLYEGALDDLAYAGWEVRDAFALAGLKARLQAAGVTVESGSPDLIRAREVVDLIRFSDPDGNLHEAYYGPLQRPQVPFVSPIGVTFKTGRQGLGHIVLRCRDKAAMLTFFEGQLGFRVSDHIRTEVAPGRPLDISFLRCNGRHHSLALVEMPTPKAIVHLMVEVATLDEVGRALHRCQAAGTHLSFTLGRHSNDQMVSFYPLSPSGFDVEYGWGGLEVDDEHWRVLTHDQTSVWGHVYQRPPRPAAPEASR